MTSSEVVALTYFEGVPTPMVEIWTPVPPHSDCVDAPTSYAYLRMNQPPCATREEWLAMLGRSTRTVFLKASPNESAPEVPRES
jgi:hypothetical protein